MVETDGVYLQLIDLAWQEFLVASGTRGVSPEVLIGFSGVPDWFRLGECGYGQDQGPSLSTTYDRWRRTNAKLLAQGEAEPAPTKKPSANRPVAAELDELLAKVRRIVFTPHEERHGRPPELDDAHDDLEAA